MGLLRSAATAARSSAHGLVGILLLGAAPAGAEVMVGGWAENFSCSGLAYPTVFDPSYAATSAESSGGSAFFSATSEPEFGWGTTVANATPFGNSTCARAWAGARTDDLVCSSLGGSETTIHARMNVTVTSDWSTNYSGGGANLNWQIYASSGLALAVPGGPGTGSGTVCYTSPWAAVPVGPPVALRWGVEGGAVGGGSGGQHTTNTVTQTPGCEGLPFIEIQEIGFSCDSEELGIAGGSFVTAPAPVPALPVAGRLGLSGAVLAAGWLSSRRRARIARDTPGQPAGALR